MTKKGENIYKRKDNRWEGRYPKGRTKQNKIIYGSVYGKTYQEVKQKLNILKAKNFETHRQLNPYTGTFSDWLSYWFLTKVKHEVKPTTYSSYSRMVNKYINPMIGHYPLKKLSVGRVQSFIYSLQAQELSPGTIHNIISLVKNCLSEAKIQGYLLENPCELVNLPKNRKKEIQILTIEQQRTLEVTAFQDIGCSPVILSLYSGLRIGEISGLKWSDIDFQKNIIYVKRTVSRIIAEDSTSSKTILIEGTPKSENSNREIPLANNLREYLLEHKNKRKSEYVISMTASAMDPRTITYRFKSLLKQTELPNIKFHVLRHTFATRCIEKGIDIASLSKILGHQSIKMTLDTYTGSLMETRRTAMMKLDQMFKQPS